MTGPKSPSGWRGTGMRFFPTQSRERLPETSDSARKSGPPAGRTNPLRLAEKGIAKLRQLPTFSVVTLDVFGRFRRVGGPHARSSPFQLLADSQGDATKENNLGEISS